MSRHVTSSQVQCPRCGAMTKRTYVAESRGGRLRFGYSFRCPSCSLAEEGDGPELSDEARAAFLAAEGHWAARVRDLGPRRADALRALGRLRSEPPSRLLQIIREAQPVKEGALVEVEHFEKVLKELGADVVLTRESE